MASNFSLTQAQVREITFYRDTLQVASDHKKTASDALSTQFRCTAVVLGLLALLAAAGSAALIVLSHGPYYSLPYFISGVVVGAASIGFLIWLAIAYAYSSGRQGALKNALKNEKEKSISFEDVLPKMIQADPAEIENVMQALDKPTQRQIITKTYEAFFGGEDPQPLTPEQKKVVSAFTHCEEALVEQIGVSDRNFAWNLIQGIEGKQLAASIIEALVAKIGVPTNEAEANWLFSYVDFVTRTPDKDRNFAVLKYITPNPDAVSMVFFMGTPSSEDEANSLLRHPTTMAMILEHYPSNFALELLRYAPTDHQESALLDALFLKMGNPHTLTKDHAEILARHPKALLRFMTHTNWDGWIAGYPSVVADLAHTHSSIFTPQILTRIYLKMDRVQKTQFLNRMVDVRDQLDQTLAMQQVNAAAVQPLISLLIKDVIARKDPSRGSDDYKNLLVAMGRWPNQCAKSIFETGFSSPSSINKELIAMELSVLSVLYSKMEPAQQDLFKKAAVQTLSSRKNAAKIYPQLITVARTKMEWKGPLFAIMAQTPQIMAEAMCINGVKEEVEIRDMMSGPDSEIYRGNFMKIYAGKSDFEEQLTGELFELQKDSKKISTSYAIAYFNQFPEKFTCFVLENSLLGEKEKDAARGDAARGELALNFLEQMEGKQAQLIIETMDKGLTLGYPFYNYLTNLLVLEAEKKGVVDIPASRALLMARFAFAHDKKLKIIDLTRANKPLESSWVLHKFGGALRLLLKKDHPGWVIFDGAAQSQSEHVYEAVKKS